MVKIHLLGHIASALEDYQFAELLAIVKLSLLVSAVFQDVSAVSQRLYLSLTVRTLWITF